MKALCTATALVALLSAATPAVAEQLASANIPPGRYSSTEFAPYESVITVVSVDSAGRVSGAADGTSSDDHGSPYRFHYTFGADAQAYISGDTLVIVNPTKSTLQLKYNGVGLVGDYNSLDIVQSRHGITWSRVGN